MKKSLLVKAAGLALGATLVFTGCASGNLANGSATSDAVWNDPTGSLAGVTLNFGGGTVKGPIDQVITAFEAKTGVTIKRVTYPDPYEQSLLTKVAVGDKPDLAAWQPTASELTALQASTNLLSLDGAPWLDKLDPALKDVTGILDNTRYAALVTSPSVMGVYYNKDVFAKAGITAAPKNWSEFVADASKIKATGTTPFFEAGGSQWPTQWWVQVQLAEKAKAGLWDDINTNKKQFTSPDVQTAIDNYNTLINQGLFNPDIKTATFDDQSTALLAGSTGIVLQVNALLEQLQLKATSAELDAKLGWFPISADGVTATSIPDNKNGIVAFKSGDPKREAAARQFLTFWMTTDYADFIAASNSVSIEPSVPTPSGVPQLAKTISASLADSVGSMQSQAIANPDLYINLANMIQGTVTPVQVAETTQNQFAQLAKAQGAAGF
ncbi:ABC transporter substrate-binding protein [Subtercola vilae]|uniref:Carbohydrate ABC transporter substrate-binding protein n=1 Tax=Subtercola vilae TaxID=2056433 RepID=A0A4T2C7V6_9MICO|nr:ABC transporter substrate-binding protein [Subtercola vilae]TIH38666.1 carbohydrate ABC transporter substrate-binding protein [Subtercola vilae]